MRDGSGVTFEEPIIKERWGQWGKEDHLKISECFIQFRISELLLIVHSFFFLSRIASSSPINLDVSLASTLLSRYQSLAVSASSCYSPAQPLISPFLATGKLLHRLNHNTASIAALTTFRSVRHWLFVLFLDFEFWMCCRNIRELWWRWLWCSDVRNLLSHSPFILSSLYTLHNRQWLWPYPSLPWSSSPLLSLSNECLSLESLGIPLICESSVCHRAL